jgi:4-amino-4-deoxy-L-arabinose transferase-like glycosyltransferase
VTASGGAIAQLRVRASPPTLALAAVVAVGLVARIAMAGQSLYGDERFTYLIATEASFGDLLDAVSITERTPPLYYALAWVLAKVGDPTFLIRLPSILLGAATIPITYVLARRWRGPEAGLLAATMFALAPAALFFGSEARAYATVGFLIALAALALLLALARGRGWWALYFAAATGAVYSHYIAVFPICAMLAWSLWSARDRWRAIALANGAVALAYVPWVPSVDPTTSVALADVGVPPSEIVRLTARTFPGFPLTGLESVPGVPALALLVAGASVVLVAAVASRLPRPAAPVPPRQRSMDAATSGRRAFALIALLAAAAPLGALAYGQIGTFIYYPRSLSVSLPFAFILFGAAIAAMPRRASLIAAGLTVAAMILMALSTLDVENARPQTARAAEVVEEALPDGGRVIQIPGAGDASIPVLNPPGLFGALMGLPADRLPEDIGIYLPPGYEIGFDARSSDAWNEQDRVVVLSVAGRARVALPAIARRRGFLLTDTERLPGAVELELRTFEHLP